MSGDLQNPPTPLQWRLECLGHSLIEAVVGCLPGPLVFRMGEALGGLAWHFFPLRRKMILRNLRIAFAGEKDLPELRRMARETFCRTGANLISAARTAHLPAERLGEVIHVENIELLEQSLAGGKGVVLLLSHMGNWEILSRLVHFFPRGSKAGAFYRPLNNRLLDKRVLDRRQADGTRMFSKGDNPLHVAGFLREGGIVGILADQRVGHQGELVEFFGRITRASPLPSLLARRSKSTVLALSVVTESPGKWKAVFMPVTPPPTTPNCMVVLERAMKAGPVDVFWFQERWKIYTRKGRTIRDWMGPGSLTGNKPHRALIWLAGVAETWRLPEDWTHPDVVYEVALTSGTARPSWLPETTRIHEVPASTDRDTLQKHIATIDGSTVLPLDYILAPGAPKTLVKAGHREAITVISLP
jgi:KDO2-lipid IV(A) lauroyltransferase